MQVFNYALCVKKNKNSQICGIRLFLSQVFFIYSIVQVSPECKRSSTERILAEAFTSATKSPSPVHTHTLRSGLATLIPVAELSKTEHLIFFC